MSMSNIVPLRAGQMPAVFAGRANLPDMNKATGEGLAAAFCVIGYKGRNWRLKYRGEDELIKDEKGVPIPYLPVVIVGVSPAISKQFYDKKFSEGDNEAPDCFSINGIAPDVSSPKKQCVSCAACPQNVWGSRVTEAGKKAKNCQDSRRIAVVPLGDIENEGYGGPMMLRVPPMSLGNLAKFGTDIQRFGAQPFMIATQLGFNYDVAYPLIEFQALGWLDEAQAVAVAGVMEDPLIQRMLETEMVEATADPASEQGALAGGAPAGAFAGQPPIDYAKAEADMKAQAEALAKQQAEAAAVKARAEAKAYADALAKQQAEAEAAKAKAAAAAAQATTTTAKKNPFGAAPAQAAPTPATQPVTQPLAETASAAQDSAVILQQAPQDMDQAIDDLLAS